ncbi:MAG: DUF4290 domain-containing protein [Fimbriimonadaceae bacterium]|nr:DUF4290 domain-containing protein [Chitinophagales bacterium]
MTYNYNSQRPKLILREYGRNIQTLIDDAIKIQDDAERQKVVLDIIDLMGSINPSLRNVDDFRHKLWDHLFMMSDFKLKADSPYPIPERETLQRKNKRLPYPKSNIKFRHYGKFVEALITKAKNIEDQEKKQAFTDIIGNYMKLVYQNWNSENVSDDIITTDIKFLSGGELSLDEDSNIDSLSKSSRRPQQHNQNRNNPNNKNRNFRQNQSNSRYGQNNRNFKKRG